MQQKRSNLERWVSLTHDERQALLRQRFAAQSPEDVWDGIEDEFGPLDRLSDEDLKQVLGPLMWAAAFANEGATASLMRLPAVVWVQMLQSHVSALRKKKAGGSIAIEQISGQLRVMRSRLVKRPKHRPRENWHERRFHEQACVELKRMTRELMASDGMNYNAARLAAADRIAPQYGWSPSTLLTRASSPGRFRRRK
jgi:hypothetical protein